MGGSSHQNHYLDGHQMEPADGVPTYIQENDHQQTGSLMLNHGIYGSRSADNHSKLTSDNDRQVWGSAGLLIWSEYAMKI